MSKPYLYLYDLFLTAKTTARHTRNDVCLVTSTFALVYEGGKLYREHFFEDIVMLGISVHVQWQSVCPLLRMVSAKLCLFRGNIFTLTKPHARVIYFQECK